MLNIEIHDNNMRQYRDRHIKFRRIQMTFKQINHEKLEVSQDQPIYTYNKRN
jgi:hypothetical protein